VKGELTKANEGKLIELENRSKYLTQKIEAKEAEISDLKKM
jgi:hypothetical protein